MEFNQILELIDHVSASELTAFTYETADLTLSMEHGKPQIIQGVMGETVENIPAAGMAGGKDATETQAVNTASAQSTEQSKPERGRSDRQPGNISAGRNLLCCTVTGSSALRSGGRQGKKRTGSCNRGSYEADE